MQIFIRRGNKSSANEDCVDSWFNHNDLLLMLFFEKTIVRCRIIDVVYLVSFRNHVQEEYGFLFAINIS